MKKHLALVAVLLLSVLPAAAQTGGANQLAHGTLAQRPSLCRASRGEVYIQTDNAGDGKGIYVCPADNTWTKAGISDHGALTGLSDDDHPQYHNNARGDARYAQLLHLHGIADVTLLQAALDAKADASALTTEAAARADADTTLQTNITAEATTRDSADTALQANIDAEAAARASADSSSSTADRARPNHTGEQAVSTVTGLQAALDAKQPLDSDLTTFAGLSPGANDVIQFVSGAWAPRTTAQLKTSLGLTASDVGLGSVTNDAQTKAAVVPNTLPSAGQLLVGNAGGTAYAPLSMSGDCTFASTGAITCTKTNGASFGTLATQSGTFSGTSSGTNTGDQTSIAGITGTTAQFNTALSDNDFATLAGSETLLNKTLTSPKFASADFIADANGNELIKFPATVASAVNEVTVSNAAAGSAPSLAATGGDTNINLVLTPKGTGLVRITGTTIEFVGAGGPQIIRSGNYLQFAVSAQVGAIFGGTPAGGNIGAFLPNNGCTYWASGSSPSTSTNDTSICRLAAGVAGPGTVASPTSFVAPIKADTFSATMTINLAAGNVHSTTLTANVTSLTLSNPLAGGVYELILTQDGTGSRTVAWPASVKWPSGVAPTLSGAGKIDVITLKYDGTNYYGSSQLNY